ncbi:MAG: LysM peptidoglycan-binding domain-containing protein [Planctomycetota bacterium]|jgi:nucleoid-associated protein YgaU
MTSDAKIGLLLGLLFIFIIAFVINGLPRFRNITNGSEMTTNMVSSQNDTQPIGSRERQAPGVFNWTERANQQAYQEPEPVIEQKEDVRFKIQLPSEIPVAKDTSIMEIAEQVESTTPEPPEPAPPVQIREEKVENIAATESKPVKSVRPRFYVVSEDDSLGLVSVARKFYGPEQGNKKINIDRIFAANKRLLKSPDEVFVGQKLIIPSLTDPAAETKETRSTLAGSILEKVKSIGKNLSNRPEKAEKSKPYIVQEDDNLWRIAVKQLGDGSRYKEISKLNTNVLNDENDLTVGMLLRMPAR